VVSILFAIGPHTNYTRRFTLVVTFIIIRFETRGTEKTWTEKKTVMLEMSRKCLVFSDSIRYTYYLILSWLRCH